MTTPAMQVKPKLPAGLRWSDVWKDDNGQWIEGAREVPVAVDTRRIAGWLQLCPHPGGCAVEQWIFEIPGPERFCPEHGQKLRDVAADGSDLDPGMGARDRMKAHVRKVLAERQQKAADALRARAEALRAGAADAAKKASAESKKHRPSAIASAVAVGTGLTAAMAQPEAAMLAGPAIATAGTVAAYAGAYWLRSRAEGGDLVGRAARRAREHARHVGAGAAAFGAWLAANGLTDGLLHAEATTGVGRCVLAFQTLTGCALAWAVNRGHWEFLWAERRRLAELARLAAERAAREAEAQAAKLEELPQEPVVVRGPQTAEEVGLWMAAEWQRISRSSTVPAGFPMTKTWIVPNETRPVTAPIDGVETRIGWEFAVQAEPGALVGRGGGLQPPLIAAREWLAAMLERDPATVATVDRPGGQMNRGLLLLTDRAPLGGTVKWKGRDGVRRAGDGTIYVHIGRSITGDDVEEAAYTPGQPFGGMVVGHTGGGKSAGLILALLNDLAAAIFPTLYDPKQLVDYADFVGVFPIGVTREHRDVILHSLHAERRRRERHLSSRPLKDRHGRVRHQQSLWSVERDGPPLHHYWDEFHMEAKDQAFVGSLLEQFRLQRVAAIGGDIATQGGGLADLSDSVLRGLLNQTRMRLYRMPDNLARLAGYAGTYMPSQLPKLPGMCLTVMAESLEMPLRSAFVTREDVDGSVYDQLYAPDGSPLLRAPDLPPETVEVFEREGLMDLWRLGQGPNGLSNLQNASPVAFTGPVAAPSAGGPPMRAADVLLMIVADHPGCERRFIDGHELWWAPQGGGKAPTPSTVSRAAQSLEKSGELDRGDGYRLTGKGLTRAAVVKQALAAPAQPTAAAQVEAAAERAAEDTAAE